MDTSLYEILSVFATLKVNHSSSIGLPFYSTPPKHLKLLNGVALLTVTEGSHDVAAVTFTNHAKEQGRILTKFHIMKNRTCSDAEAKYLNTLVDLLNTCAPHKLQIRLQDLILCNCRDKIIARLVKLQKSVEEFKELIPTWEEPNKKDIDKFKDVYEPSSTEDPSWKALLSDFLTNRLHPGHFSSENSFTPLDESYFFVKGGLLSSIRSPQLARRLKKVSDYAAIIDRITKSALRERARRSFELNILPSPSRVTLAPISSPLILINQSAQALEPPMDQFMEQDLKRVTPSTVEESEMHSNRQTTEAFVHCECALAIEMRKYHVKKLEIGVSKNCCWPCMQFLKEYSKESGGIRVSGTNGKTYQNWLFPLDISHALYRRMGEMARVEFKSWLFSVNRKRISDSYAGSIYDDDSDNNFARLKRAILARKKERK